MMPIKDIFLPLVGEPRPSAIERCVAVAASLGARITALAIEEEHPQERPRVMSPDDLTVSPSYKPREVQDLLNALTNAASAAGVRARSRTCEVPADQVPVIFAEQARFFDITLFPVKPHDDRTERIVEAMLFGSGRPLLLCPEHAAEGLRSKLENVMIAWDRSARAARAVGDALPILQAAASVAVVTVAEDERDASVQSGAALIDHLREHGIHASFERVRSGGSSIGKVLGGWANSHRIDALVMGAYHHSRVKEIVWGGVTKTVIGQPPCWVMISH